MTGDERLREEQTTGDERLREEQTTGDERLREEQTTGDERLREEQTTGDERLREEQTTTADPEYDRHGGFPVFDRAAPGPGFGQFLTSMRRLQDLAVSAAPGRDTWNEAAAKAAELAALLEPSAAPEGVGPANRVPDLPGAGSLLMPPYRLGHIGPEGVELTVEFSRFHVGGNSAVHGGVLPLLFDSVFGMVIHGAGRPISRTGFLHVDYRRVTPIEKTLTARGWMREVDGRKAFVNAELRDPDGALLAEANGLMIRLLAGQP